MTRMGPAVLTRGSDIEIREYPVVAPAPGEGLSGTRHLDDNEIVKVALHGRAS